MIRTLLTLAKISIVLAAVIWVAEHPGRIKIEWLDYTLDFHIGFFLIALFVLLALGIILFAFTKGILDFPKTFARYKMITAKDKGLKAFATGLSAIAAGDVKGAARQAYRTQKFLDDGNPLSLLLKAQVARLNGDEAGASRAFIELMKDKNAGFMGVRGLLQNALERGDYDGALELGRKALKDYPRQGWILNIVYDLELKARNWAGAGKILVRAQKAGAITREKALSDRVAILLAQGLEYKNSGDNKAYMRALQKAYRIDTSFLPTALWKADAHIENGQYRAAVRTIEKAWKCAPHPELTQLWAKACRPPKNNNTMARVRWFEKLLKLDPQSVEGLQAMASIMTQEQLWGDARRYLEMAEKIRPNVHLYKLWAKLEEKATGNEMAVCAWLEKAADAPREKVWICSETGRVYDEWVPVSDQGLFNTIIWDFPQGRNFALPHIGSTRQIARLITSSI